MRDVCRWYDGYRSMLCLNAISGFQSVTYSKALNKSKAIFVKSQQIILSWSKHQFIDANWNARKDVSTYTTCTTEVKTCFSWPIHLVFLRTISFHHVPYISFLFHVSVILLCDVGILISFKWNRIKITRILLTLAFIHKGIINS